MRVKPALPKTVLLDLDDTILHFSADQPDFWQLALREVLSARGPGGEPADLADPPARGALADGSRRASVPVDYQALRASIEAESDRFWIEPERAFWGRQNMWEARRGIARAALAPLGVAEAVAERIGDAMTRLKEEYVRPFDGAIETLEWLRHRGHRLALLTNGSSQFQRRKIERFGLGQFFELVMIEGELGYGKPDPRVYQQALGRLQVDPADCCMVGDNLTADIGGAQRVGICGIWHDAQGRGLPDTATVVPDRIIDRLRDLR